MDAVTASTGFGGAGAMSASSGGPMVTTSLEEVVLGKQEAGAPFTFDVPEGTLGFTVVVKAQDPYGRMGVKQLLAPSQDKLIQNYKLPGTDWEFSWYGLTPAGVPQSDVASAMPKPSTGLWSVTLGDPYDNTQSGVVSVWFRKSSDGAFHGGQMDVNVFRVPSVSSDAYVDAFVEKAYNGWAGLSLGTITHYPLAETFQTVDGANFLSVVEQSMAASNTPAINIYVIESFANELKDAIGVAAGIPGVGIAPGSHSSGVVVSPTSDLETDSLVLKHESGHLSGLFHTTEIKGGQVDPLSDTLTCSDVEGLVFGCPDSGNIMFPYANSSATEFSMMQQTVIHGATLYRGAFDTLSGNKLKAPPAASAPPAGASGVPLPSPVAKGAWRSHLSQAAADFISAHWCLRSKNIDHAALLQRLATPRELSAVAADPSTPSWLRARAKRAVLARP